MTPVPREPAGAHGAHRGRERASGQRTQLGGVTSRMGRACAGRTR